MVAAVTRLLPRLLGWRRWVMWELWRLQVVVVAARLYWKVTVALVPLDADADYWHWRERRRREEAAFQRFMGVLADLREGDTRHGEDATEAEA